MIINTKIETEVRLEKLYVLRAICNDGILKKVIAEKNFDKPPSNSDIASFLDETKADFVSLVENFRLINNDLSFD